MRHTRAEKKFRNLMFLYAALFLLGGTLFYLQPDITLSRINTVGTWLGFDPLPLSEERFWLFLASSLMATITVCCFIAALSVRKTRHFVIPVLVSKLVTSALALTEFITVEPARFPHLAIFLVDFPLFAIALWYYIRALWSARGERANENSIQPENTVYATPET